MKSNVTVVGKCSIYQWINYVSNMHLLCVTCYMGNMGKYS